MKLVLSIIFSLGLVLTPTNQATAGYETIFLKDPVLIMISFNPSVPPHPILAFVEELDLDGYALVSYNILEQDSLQKMQISLPVSDLIKEVPSFKGFKSKDSACLTHDTSTRQRGTEVRIERLFPNGVAEVQFDNFFKRNFSFFNKNKPTNKMLTINDLQPCH